MLTAKAEPTLPLTQDSHLEAELEQYLIELNKDTTAASALLRKIAAQPYDTAAAATKTRIFVYLAGMYAAEQDPQAEVYLQKAWQLAEEENHADIWAEVLAEHLQQAWERGEKLKALDYQARLKLWMPQVTSPRVGYFAANVMARFYAWQGHFDQALAAFHQAHSSIEQDPSPLTPSRLLFIQGNIASLHSRMRNFTLALTTIQQVIAKSIDNPELQHWLPESYLQEGYILVELQQLEKAIAANTQGLIWARRLQHKTTEATLLNNLGDIYLRQSQFTLAEQHFQQTLQISGSEQKHLVDLANFNLGYLQVLQGDLAAGIERMAYTMQQIRSYAAQSDVMEYLKELADAYRIAQQYQSEATTLREYNSLAAEIFQAERQKQLNQLQEEFSAKEKSQQIAVLTQQNQLKEIAIERQKLQQQVTWLVVAVVFMVAFLLFLLFKNVRAANQKLKEANDQLAYQSLHDPLTGLFNRRSLQEHMEKRQFVQERRQAEQTQLGDGFILLDIDFFKHINDHFGHAAGDQVLIEIAKRLTNLTRNDDMVLRWGGEEFLILVRRVDIKALTQFTQRVLDCIGTSPVQFSQHSIPVTASAGFLTFPFAGLTEHELPWHKALQLADMALYLGKVHGRNRAYGLQTLREPYESIQQQLHDDLSVAIEQGHVEAVMVKGPARPTIAD